MNALQYAAGNVDAIPPLWRIITKFGYFFGLAALIGATWTHWLVVRPSASLAPTPDAARLRSRSAKLAGLGALVMAVVAYPQLAGRVARAGDGMPYGEALNPTAVWAYLTKPAKVGEWVSTGTLVSIQNLLIAAVALMLAPLLFGKLTSRADVLIATAAPLSVAISLVGSVPTKAMAAQDVLNKVLVQGHIIGGSLWVGGLLAMALLARTRSRLSPASGEAWMRMWQRFGVLALVSVAMVIVSGIWLTWREVGAWEQFVTTPFGRFLAVKIVLVAALVGAGAYNQLVLMPKIARAQRAGDVDGVFRYVLTTFPAVVMTEVVLGVSVLALVPFLNGGARSQAAGREVDPPLLDAGLIGLGALLVATVIASFYATAKASASLGKRPVEEVIS